MQKQEFRNLHCVWGNNKKGRLKRNSFVHLCTYWWQIKGDVWGVVHSAQWVASRLWPLLCAFYLNMFCFLLQSCVTFFGHKITWLIKSQPHEADQQCTVLFTCRKKQKSHRSHPTLRAKRAKFTFWVEKSSMKMAKATLYSELFLEQKNTVGIVLVFSRSFLGVGYVNF